MSPEEVIQAALAGSVASVEGIDPASAAAEDGAFSVGGLVVLRVGALSSFFGETNDLAVADENGTEFGTLCFTRRLEPTNPESLTKWQYAAYLAEVSPEGLGVSYKFLNDYLVIDQAFAQEYRATYASGAPIWGGFTHDPPAPRTVSPVRAAIVAFPGIALPTTGHKESLNRYVEATNAFDRFMKLYHALELLFDFAVMKQMQSMGDDMNGFGKVISSYNSKELDRLRHIIFTYCDEPSKIASKISDVGPHLAKAEEIFQEFGKDGNPLKEELSWNKFCQVVAGTQLSEADVATMKGVSNANDYRKFISNVSSYWIYRIRSSIAHSRVGEFLFLESDEPFVAEFAESLLLEVVRQVLSGATLRALI